MAVLLFLLAYFSGGHYKRGLTAIGALEWNSFFFMLFVVALMSLIAQFSTENEMAAQDSQNLREARRLLYYGHILLPVYETLQASF